MALTDLQSFLQERLQAWDPTADVGPGSDADTQVIQPVLRRLGPDPFSVDVRAFLMDRLNQEFPDMATSDGDAITDLLIKPSELFLDPIVRENARVRNNLSFRDPTTLTLDEADSLGANFFVSRQTGQFSGGTARIYFAAPQSQSINPSNYVTSRSGLTFFPTSVQSISVDEMLFNTEANQFYFDVTVAAETAGDQYNIDAGELVSIAGVSSAVSVTNKVRFTKGIQAEDAPTYIGRVQQSITERSLVTKRGIVTQLSQNFPEMTRLNVVGMNDPEMQRDIIEADSVGPIRAAGTHGFAQPDGNNGANTSWFTYDNSLDANYDFTQLIGPPGDTVVGWYLTLHGSFLGAPPVQDIKVIGVISPLVLELSSEIIPLAQSGMTWELRNAVLTLSKIPGGILFPNSPNGTVTVPDDSIHIGGCTDIHVRGTVLDQSSMTINVLSDDEPLLSGFQALSQSLGPNVGKIILQDLILGVNYNVGDATYNALANAYSRVDQLQVLTGVGAGVYRILAVTQAASLPPVLTVLPTPVPFSPVRWRLVDEINIDLLEPKETFIEGADLETVQGSFQVTTASAVDFLSFGVAANDTLRIKSGPDASDFTIQEVTPFPNFTVLVLNRQANFTRSNLQYEIFRPASSQTLNSPMVRIDTIQLLDQNGQPVGSNIPYALPIGGFSTAFAHPGKGLKFDIEDALLGIIGIDLGSPPTANVSGLVLQVFIPDTGLGPQTLTFTGVNPIPLSSIISQINGAFNTAGYPGVVAIDAGNRLGILGNIGPDGAFITGGIGGGSAIPPLFGFIPGTTNIPYLSSFMVRAPEFDNNPNFFLQMSPPLDVEYDVLQTLDGAQIGFFTVDYLYPWFNGRTSLDQDPTAIVPSGLTHPNAIWLNTSLVPQDARHIQFGARSIGRARLYFLEPTTMQVNSTSQIVGVSGGVDVFTSTPTVFTATLPSGVVLRFFGDPAESAQILPPLPSGVKPEDGQTTAAGTTLTSLSQDFVANDVQIGDELVIDYIPITGSVALADPVVGFGFTTFIFSIGGSPDITLTFNRDNLALAPTSVTRQGVADEINAAAGVSIASINGTNNLEIVATAAFVIRKSGTSNTLLGFSTVADTNNASANANTYTVTGVTDSTHLTFTPATPNNESNEQFTIVRNGVQRIGTTSMSKNVGPTGLYYCDVELVSEGTGDIYDIDENTSFVITNVQSDGYYLTTSDSNLTFSPAEDIELHISKTINEVGTSDSLADATTLLGQNIQVNYEYSALTSSINNFVLSDQERVINESPLTRHLIPYFVRFDAPYAGGPSPAAVQPTVETLIQALFPDQQLQVSDIQAILTRQGASSITNPLTLFGVIYNLDRSVSLEMSQDRLNATGRLAAFIPDVINLLQSLT